jgi:tRNA uridine 5-carboxymethylaminomethyl modification enzyme
MFHVKHRHRGVVNLRTIAKCGPMYDVLVIGGGHAGCEAAAAAARGERGSASLRFAPGRRPDVVQSLDRRSRQGPSRPRARRVRRIDGARRRPPRYTGECSIEARAPPSRARESRRTAAFTGSYRPAARRMRRRVGHLRSLGAGCPKRPGRRPRNQCWDLICRSLVIATGTFLGARMFLGERTISGGRWGERAAIPLAAQLRDIGLGQGRLKTGTPPRLDGRTIDWSRLQEQPSEPLAWTMSSLDDGIPAAAALRDHADQ